MNDGRRAFRLAGLTIVAAFLGGCLYAAGFLAYHRYFTPAKIYGPGQYVEEHPPSFRPHMPRWIYWTVVTGQGLDQKIVYMGPTGHSLTIGYMYKEWRPVGLGMGHPYGWVILLPVAGMLLAGVGQSLGNQRVGKWGLDLVFTGFITLPVLFFVANNVFVEAF